MNIQENNFNEFFNGILEDLTEENKNESIVRIKQIFVMGSEMLIPDLQNNANINNNYRSMEERLSQIDPQLANEIHPYIERIQKIAVSLTIANFNEYINYRFPQDLERIRSIPDPELKAYFMSLIYVKSYEENQIPLSLFSKQELIAMGPHLSSLDLKGTEDWDVRDINEILNACTNLCVLTIKDHPTIELIPPLATCRNLICNNCPALSQLSALPNCVELNCRGCSSLIALPELPKVEDLDVSDCTSLPHIPPLPLCTSLNCNRCSVLRSLSDLPNCELLFYDSCPLLDPATVPVRFSNLQARVNLDDLGFLLGDAGLDPQARPTLYVKMDELNQNPLKVLIEAGSSLLDGTGIPSIKFIEPKIIEEGGEPSIAIDQGGPTRSFMTKIIQALIANAEEPHQLPFDKDPLTKHYEPILDFDKEITENQIKGFRILGALFAECLSKNFLIDRFFHPSLFKGITSLTSEELEALPADLKKIPDDLIFKLLFATLPGDELKTPRILIQKLPNELTPEDIAILEATIETGEMEFQSLVKPEEILNAAKLVYLDKIRKRDKLIPIVLIAKQMHLSQVLQGDNTWDQFCARGGEALQKQLEGSLDNQIVSEALVWDSDVSIEDTNKTKGFVEKWITEASSEELRNFVFTITGLPSLTHETRLKFKLKNDGMRVPEAHTCFCMVDLSGDYPNYEIFQSKLKTLIENSINPLESGYGRV